MTSQFALRVTQCCGELGGAAQGELRSGWAGVAGERTAQLEGKRPASSAEERSAVEVEIEQANIRGPLDGQAELEGHARGADFVTGVAHGQRPGMHRVAWCCHERRRCERDLATPARLQGK